jgi:hypothetical protein
MRRVVLLAAVVAAVSAGLSPFPDVPAAEPTSHMDRVCVMLADQGLGNIEQVPALPGVTSCTGYRGDSLSYADADIGWPQTTLANQDVVLRVSGYDEAGVAVNSDDPNMPGRYLLEFLRLEYVANVGASLDRIEEAKDGARQTDQGLEVLASVEAAAAPDVGAGETEAAASATDEPWID